MKCSNKRFKSIKLVEKTLTGLIFAVIVIGVFAVPVLARDGREYYGRREYREHRGYYGHGRYERRGGYYYPAPVYVAPPPVVYAPPPPPPGITFVFPLHIR